MVGQGWVSFAGKSERSDLLPSAILQSVAPFKVLSSIKTVKKQGYLIAAASSSKHGLRPPADLDGRMGPDDLVALFRQRLVDQRRHHFLRLRG